MSDKTTTIVLVSVLGVGLLVVLVLALRPRQKGLLEQVTDFAESDLGQLIIAAAA